MKTFKKILKKYQFYFLFFFSGGFLLIFYFSMLGYLNGITQNLNYVDVTPNDQIIQTDNKNNDFHSFLAGSYKNYGVYNLQGNNQITFNGNINHLKRYNMDDLNLKTWKNEEINAQLILIKNNPNQELKNLTIETDNNNPNIKVETKFMNFINARKNRNNSFITPFDQHIADWIKTDTIESYNWTKYQVLPVWITIKTNKDIEAGLYPINLTVNYDNIQTAKHTINLTVNNRVLPDLVEQEYYNLDLWQNWDRTLAYYENETNQKITINSEEYFTYLEPYMEHLTSIGEEIFNLNVDKFLEITPNGNNDINIQFNKDLDIDSYLTRILGYGFKHFTLTNPILKYQEFKLAFNFLYLNENQMVNSFNTYQNFIFNYFNNKKWGNDVQPKIYINLDELSPSVFQQGIDDLDALQGNNKVFSLSVDVNYVFWTSQKTIEILKQVDRLSISYPYLNFMDANSHSKVMELINYRERENKFTSIYSCTNDYPANFVKSQPGESAWIPLYGLKYNIHNFLRWSYNIWPQGWIAGKGVTEADDPDMQLESGDLYSVYPLDEKMQVGLSPRIQLLVYGQEQAIKLQMLKQEQPEQTKNIINKIEAIYWPNTFTPNWNLFTRSLNKNVTVNDQLNLLVTELNKL